MAKEIEQLSNFSCLFAALRHVRRLWLPRPSAVVGSSLIQSIGGSQSGILASPVFARAKAIDHGTSGSFEARIRFRCIGLRRRRRRLLLEQAAKHWHVRVDWSFFRPSQRGKFLVGSFGLGVLERGDGTTAFPQNETVTRVRGTRLRRVPAPRSLAARDKVSCKGRIRVMPARRTRLVECWSMARPSSPTMALKTECVEWTLVKLGSYST